MTRIVIDASVTISAVLPEAHSAQARTIMQRVAVAGACVPSLWHLEVGNVLLLAERRRKLTQARRVDCLADLAALPVIASILKPGRRPGRPPWRWRCGAT